jgi:hypothetical protein
VDSVKLNEPPPDWLVSNAKRSDQPEPRPEWMGREAPNFTLPNLEGQQVRLTAMRQGCAFGLLGDVVWSVRSRDANR